MKAEMCSILGVSLCLWLAGSVRGHDTHDANEPNHPPARIVLTKFDVNDTVLNVSLRIRNDSNHDIWICTDPDIGNNLIDREVYLAMDNRTLEIRRRLNVPTTASLDEQPYGEYAVLHPGQDRNEVLSLAMPILPLRKYQDNVWGAAGTATRLVVEIGFYDQDLPAMVREILAQAEAFYDGPFIRNDVPSEVVVRYFPGILLRSYFMGLSSFNKNNEDRIKEGRVVIPYTRQILKGEKVLRMELEGVCIPCAEAYWW